MSFISKEELSLHFLEGTVDAISDAIITDDESKVNESILAAVEEAASYMSRFNVDALFGASGEDRNPILLLYIKDIAAWHFIALANPNIDIETRRTRYEFAISWFIKVQSGKISPRGWPAAVPDESGADASKVFKYGSNKKKTQHY